MRHRILVVDDEQPLLNLLTASLGDHYIVETARSADEALQRLRTADPYAVIIADLIMPGMNGIDLLAECEKIDPLTVRVVLTGDPKRQTVIDVINRGHVFQFIPKPVMQPELTATVEAAVRQHDVLRAEQGLLDTTLRTSINLLLEVLSTLDAHSFELSERVRRSVGLFARRLRMPNAWELEMAASLARIGAATLPTDELHKVASGDTPLDHKEEDLVQRIPLMGWQMLKAVPRMERVAEAVRYQSKHFDGGGYPGDDIAGDQIPIGARILKVFMDRAALEVDGVAKAKAREQMGARAGVYDPMLLEASFRCFPDYILSGISATEQVRIVPAADLQANQVLVAEIRTSDGLLFAAAGTRLTPLILQRIHNHVALKNISEPFCVQPPAAETADVATAAPMPAAAVA
jgi:response regulator RpfG family c-di-GMP phosphodiesterase